MCVQAPCDAVNVWPCCAIPKIVGTAEFVGMISMTAAVGGLTVTTVTVIILPTSAALVAPEIGVPARFHWYVTGGGFPQSKR